MTTTATASRCPAWCSPLHHVALTDHDHDHRDPPTTWEVPDHVVITVGRSQLDNPTLGDLDHVHLRLSLDDGDNTVVVDLHPGDADTLIAALTERRALIACGHCGRGHGHERWCPLA